MKKIVGIAAILLMVLALVCPARATYKKIVVIKTAIKLPGDADITMKGKQVQSFKKGDRVYFENGEVKVVPKGEIHVPEPNMELPK